MRWLQSFAKCATDERRQSCSLQNKEAWPYCHFQMFPPLEQAITRNSAAPSRLLKSLSLSACSSFEVDTWRQLPHWSAAGVQLSFLKDTIVNVTKANWFLAWLWTVAAVCTTESTQHFSTSNQRSHTKHFSGTLEAQGSLSTEFSFPTGEFCHKKRNTRTSSILAHSEYLLY